MRKTNFLLQNLMMDFNFKEHELALSFSEPFYALNYTNT